MTERQEIREGIERLASEHFTYIFPKYVFTNKLMGYLSSQGVGLRVDLKTPENPYDETSKQYEGIARLTFNEAIEKFKELNEGFEPL